MMYEVWLNGGMNLITKNKDTAFQRYGELVYYSKRNGLSFDVDIKEVEE